MALRLDDLRPTPGSRHKQKRVGRGIGSGMGKQSTRGAKGQTRASGKVPAMFEGGQTPLFRRIPIRGFKNINAKHYAVVNLSVLEERFTAGSEVTPEVLLEMRILNKLEDGVKILGDGELTKSLVVKAKVFSKSAKDKIEAVGGKAEVI